MDANETNEIKTAKREARAKARRALLAISAAGREERSQKAAALFLNSSIYKNAECVAAFLSLPDEIDTLPIIERAFMDKKRVLLPRVVPGSNAMDFYELSAIEAQTDVNAWGIREPLETLALVGKEGFPARAAILVPGLAFCKDGRRLGRGKGFYDRYLSELLAANPAFAAQGKICGYCFSEQIFSDIPTQESDVRVQAVFSSQSAFF